MAAAAIIAAHSTAVAAPETTASAAAPAGAAPRAAVAPPEVTRKVIILFDKDRARVKSAGRRALSAALATLGEQGDRRKILVEGHSDARGPSDYNLWLSQERARRVRQAIIDLGIDPALVESAGYGHTRPRDARPNEAGWQRDRRVELVLVSLVSDGIRRSRRPPTWTLAPAPIQLDQRIAPIVGGAVNFPASPVIR